MKKVQIKVGGRYTANVSGHRVTVRVDRIQDTSNANGRAVTTYNVTNLRTHRTTTFRSVQRFIAEVADAPKAHGNGRVILKKKTVAAPIQFKEETIITLESLLDVRSHVGGSKRTKFPANPLWMRSGASLLI